MAGAMPPFQTQFGQSPSQSDLQVFSPTRTNSIPGSQGESLLRGPRTLAAEVSRALELSRERERERERGERGANSRLTPQSSPPLNNASHGSNPPSRTSPLLPKKPSTPAQLSASKPDIARVRPSKRPVVPAADWTKLVNLGARDLRIPREQEEVLSRDESWLTPRSNAQKQNPPLLPGNDLALLKTTASVASPATHTSVSMTQPKSHEAPLANVEQPSSTGDQRQMRDESPEEFVRASQWPASPSRNGLPADTDDEDEGSPQPVEPRSEERYHDSLQTWSNSGSQEKTSSAETAVVIDRPSLSQTVNPGEQNLSAPIDSSPPGTALDTQDGRDPGPGHSSAKSGSAAELLAAVQRDRSVLTQASAKQNSNIQIKETPYLSNSDRRTASRYDLPKSSLGHSHVIPGTFISPATQESALPSSQDFPRHETFPASQDSVRQDSSPVSSAMKSPLVSALRTGKRISSSQDAPGQSAKKVRLVIEEPVRRPSSVRNNSDSQVKPRGVQSTPTEQASESTIDSVTSTTHRVEVTTQPEVPPAQVDEAQYKDAAPVQPTTGNIVPTPAPDTTLKDAELAVPLQSEPAVSLPLEIVNSEPANLFAKFARAYPQYRSSESQFQSMCQTLVDCHRQRFFHTALWDDITLRQFEDYATYLVDCSKTGEDPISPYRDFYFRVVKTPLYMKGVLNLDDVSTYLRESSLSTEAMMPDKPAQFVAPIVPAAPKVSRTTDTISVPVQPLTGEPIPQPVQSGAPETIDLDAPARLPSSSPEFEAALPRNILPRRRVESSPAAPKSPGNMVTNNLTHVSVHTNTPVRMSLSPVKTRASFGSPLPAARPKPVTTQVQIIENPKAKEQLRSSVRSKYQSPLIALVRDATASQSNSSASTTPPQKNITSLKAAARPLRHSLPSSFQASQPSSTPSDQVNTTESRTPNHSRVTPAAQNTSAAQHPTIAHDDSLWIHDDDTPFKRYTHTNPAVMSGRAPNSEPRKTVHPQVVEAAPALYSTPRQETEVIDVDGVGIPAWVHNKNNAFKRYTQKSLRRSLPASFAGIS